MTPDYIYGTRSWTKHTSDTKEAKQWVLNLGQCLTTSTKSRTRWYGCRTIWITASWRPSGKSTELKPDHLGAEGDLECDESDIAFYETEIAPADRTGDTSWEE